MSFAADISRSMAMLVRATTEQIVPLSYPSQLSDFVEAVADEGIYSRFGNLGGKRLLFYLRNLFRGVDLTDKTVLDVGSGAGVFSFYAAMAGAKSVVALEPSAAGSSEGTDESFRRLAERLGCRNVIERYESLQNLPPDIGPFDIILFHNSINHIDEAACRDLLSNPEARRTYARIFDDLRKLLNPGGRVVVCD